MIIHWTNSNTRDKLLPLITAFWKIHSVNCSIVELEDVSCWTTLQWLGAPMYCGLVWIPTPFSSFRCTFCLNRLNNLRLQLYCPKNQRAILSWVLHCLLFDHVTTAYCQLSFSAFLSRVSSVLHNFPLLHMADGTFAGFKCEITE